MKRLTFKLKYFAISLAKCDQLYFPFSRKYLQGLQITILPITSITYCYSIPIINNKYHGVSF